MDNKVNKQLNIDILRSFIKDDRIKIYYDNNSNIIIEGNVIIFPDEDYKNYTEFPVKVHKVIGNIHWYGGITTLHNQIGTLASLHNFPDIVEGDVIIFKNPMLQSLEDCPKHISGTLQADFCNIKSIDGIAEYIGNNCILNNNPITDISPLYNITVNGIISIVNTPAAYNTEQINKLKDVSVLNINENSEINYFI